MRHERDWMLTFTGKAYWPLDPSVDDVDILDIAHGLSMLCRYSGQSRHFYSVAEHCVHVSYMVPRAFALEALLHDATEAYLGDMIRPIKHAMPEYKDMEATNDQVIRIKFGLPPYESPEVKEADNDILQAEYEELLPPLPNGRTWHWPGKKVKCYIHGWEPTVAKGYFLARFNELCPQI